MDYRRVRPPSFGALLLLVALLCTTWYVAGSARQARDTQLTPAHLAALQYRFVGPPGNRISAVVGVPGDLNTYYAGGASGGVWKSTNGGVDWRPVADTMTAQANTTPGSRGSMTMRPMRPVSSSPIRAHVFPASVDL